MASTNEHHKQTQHQAGARPPPAGSSDVRDPIPNVRFYNFLKINWKFSVGNQYTLMQPSSSNDDIAMYRFSSTPNASSQTVRNAIFGMSQGFSKNFYKQYTVIVLFEGMSHNEALEFCSEHETSPEMICILKIGQHSIRGSNLEKELRNWAYHFKHMLFGVCSGLMESFYLLALSNEKEIEQSQLSGMAQVLRDAALESNSQARLQVERGKRVFQDTLGKVFPAK